VSASITSPQVSATCSGPTKIYFPTVAGGGVLRSQDGGTLKLNLSAGSDCIDFSVSPAGEAICTRVLQIMGGTGRFANASGTLMLVIRVVPVLEDGPNNPVFFEVTGTIAGAVPGLAPEPRPDDGKR
jgi:hypothetical protein